MVAGMQVLDNARINGVMQGLLDPRTLPGELVFSKRVKEVPATDDEVMGRFIGYIHIADLVADDQKAGAYSSGKFQAYGYNIPNLKVGSAATQAMLNKWVAMQGNPNIPQYVKDLFFGGETGQLLNLRTGVAQRKEALLAAMYMDGLTYDRLGVKINNATWGMPADLKVTVAIPWVANPTTATPVSNMWAVDRVARLRYSRPRGYKRATMSTPAFDAMIATTEFQAKAKASNIAINLLNLSLADLGTDNTEKMLNLAQDVIGKEIVLYDARYWQQQENGIWIQKPILDLNAIILDDPADDNNTGVQDFANAIVTESVVSSIVGDNVIPGGPQFGPIAYTDKVGYNPPQIEYWAVQRGFPRKHQVAATACLRVGTVTETISTAAPF